VETQDRFIVQRRFPSYRFLLITTAEPGGVSMTLSDAFGIQSRFRAVPLRHVTEPGVKTRFAFRYPLIPSLRWLDWLRVRVEGSAVPSVAGSNVHVRVRPAWAVSFINLAASCVLLVSGSLSLEQCELLAPFPIALLLLSASTALVSHRVGHIKAMLREALPGWSATAAQRRE
jgi:hypothetical protein